MGNRLENKVAVITGAASGIGAATTRLFIEQGCKVVMGDLQDAEGQALAEELGEAALYLHCDVTREEDVAALVKTAVDQFGRLDCMFNNAGIVGALGPIDTTPAEDWKFTLDVMINGVFYGMKHAAAVMKPQGSGSIVSMSSVAGVTGGLGPHAYCAAKSAIVGLTRNLATELGAYGVRANAIAAYSMATPMVAEAYLEDHQDIEGATKMLAEESPIRGRPGTALDVANAALWLASDESGYTSGHTLTTDAGVTTGSMPGPPRFSEYKPMMREAGKSGLE